MRKQFKILIIFMVIIALGIAGYFGYKVFRKNHKMTGEQLNAALNQPGIHLTTKEIEAREKGNKKPVEETKQFQKLVYPYYHPRDGRIDIERIISQRDEKVINIFKVSENFDDFGIYIITAKNPANIKGKSKKYKPTDPIFDSVYVYILNRDKIDLKVGDTIKEVDAIGNMYSIFGEILPYYLPGIYAKIAEEKYKDPKIREFIDRYFTPEKISELRLNPNGMILLAYKK